MNTGVHLQAKSYFVSLHNDTGGRSEHAAPELADQAGAPRNQKRANSAKRKVSLFPTSSARKRDRGQLVPGPIVVVGLDWSPLAVGPIFSAHFCASNVNPMWHSSSRSAGGGAKKKDANERERERASALLNANDF